MYCDQNQQLWNRIIDVNSNRTNIFLNRPVETGLGRNCSGYNYKKDSGVTDNNNLLDFELEDWLQTPDLCRDVTSTLLQSNDSICQGIETSTSTSFERFTFGKPTSQRFMTVDQRLLFIPMIQ